MSSEGKGTENASTKETPAGPAENVKVSEEGVSGDERGLEKIKRQAEREDGQLLILPSEISEEAGALSSPTQGLSSEDKGREKEIGNRVDQQGNPLNEDGTLYTEEVSDIAELRDEDFTHPSRSVVLPQLPENVDDDIGANGKRVVIKKNIFEKNAKAPQLPQMKVVEYNQGRTTPARIYCKQSEDGPAE